MELSRVAKVLLGLAAVLGVLVFLVVVDLGVHAGKVHTGVRVKNVHLGGLTQEEAKAVLSEEAAELRESPVILVIEGSDCNFDGSDVGWYPYPEKTAMAAYRVGRDGGPFRALWERFRALFGGVKVKWVDRRNATKVRRFLDECEQRVEPLGFAIRRVKLRHKIWRAIATPVESRRPFRIPVKSG